MERRSLVVSNTWCFVMQERAFVKILFCVLVWLETVFADHAKWTDEGGYLNISQWVRRRHFLPTSRISDLGSRRGRQERRSEFADLLTRPRLTAIDRSRATHSCLRTSHECKQHHQLPDPLDASESATNKELNIESVTPLYPKRFVESRCAVYGVVNLLRLCGICGVCG